MNDPSTAPGAGQRSHAPPQDSATPIVVPYWPALKRIVGSVNAALVVTYLEMHYPSPPPEPPRRYGLPVEVNFARMADDLAVDRRTLGIALMCVCTWFEEELQRIGAVRAGQEFLNRKHSRWPRLKLYSIVGPKHWRSLSTIALRRNWPQLTKTLAESRVSIDVPRGTNGRVPVPALPRLDLARFAVQPSSLDTLPEILLRGIELAGDRRRTRYSRLRKAVAEGLAPADALNVKRKPKDERREAVDPSLSDEIMARMVGRSTRSRD